MDRVIAMQLVPFKGEQIDTWIETGTGYEDELSSVVNANMTIFGS